MAGKEEDAKPEISTDTTNDTFQWDEASQLYFHASSGFYHDPNAGWYYSSRDGCYYTFEDGSYVLLESAEDIESDVPKFSRIISDQSTEDKQGLESEACEPKTTVAIDAVLDNPCDVTENHPPLSEWLEETLIDLYLAGYSNSATLGLDSMKTPELDGAEGEDCFRDFDQSCSEFSNFHHGVEFEEIEEGEWIPGNVQEVQGSCSSDPNEDTSWDEENWRAQYGQVIKSEYEDLPSVSAVDLWDWAIIIETVGKKNRQVARLIGRLVRPSAKIHPSMPVSGGLFKTATICDTHLDLVRVASGKIYKLRTPNTRYLSSLSTYDSSNPTKDWNFPDLYINMQNSSHSHSVNTRELETSAGSRSCEESYINRVQTLEHKTHQYRDRAAERRTLHGGFGIGPGQKDSWNDSSSELASSSDSARTKVAAAEAIEMSFGAGSYARRILEKMGWKEGMALGNDGKGLKEPLLAVGNKGYAGLGWNHSRG